MGHNFIWKIDTADTVGAKGEAAEGPPGCLPLR